MAAIIRENPLHQPMQKPIGSNASLPQINSVASQVKGPMFAHLGHFKNPINLSMGHNTGMRRRAQRRASTKQGAKY